MESFKVRLVNVTVKNDWQPHVTRHALIRYLERVHGISERSLLSAFDSNAIRRAIVFGATYAQIKGGKVVIQGSSIVTVLPNAMARKNKRLNKQRAQAARAERLATESGD